MSLGCSVAEAQRRISSREFAEWIAYYSLEPFGEERADLRAGVLAALTANIHRDADKHKDPFEPGDFFQSLGKRKQPPAWRVLYEKMRVVSEQLKVKK